MASKQVNKKSPAKAASAAAASVNDVQANATASASNASSEKAKAKKAAPQLASVVPFSAAFDPLKSITNSNLTNFNQAIPSLNGTFETMETTMNNFKNQYEKFTTDASSSVREGVETLSKSSATFAKGAEQILKTIAEVAQESSQRNAEAVKALMASRTLNEFAEAQNKLAQQNFDEAMSTMTKLSEMTIKLCSEALEPINGQVTKAMSSAMKKNAA